MSRVRDAMIPEPQTLETSASAQEAGEHLTQPDVRAVYVCDGGRFVGVPDADGIERRGAGRHVDAVCIHEDAQGAR